MICFTLDSISLTKHPFQEMVLKACLQKMIIVGLHDKSAIDDDDLAGDVIRQR